MPELPEVQTIVNDLKKKIIGREITAFWSDTPRILRILADRRGLNADKRGHSKFSNQPGLLSRQIKNYRIDAIKRKGKNIIFHLSKASHSQKLLIIHLKLTGRLLVGREFLKNQKNYIRAVFYLDKGSALCFSDVRKFGKIIFGDKKVVENLPDLKDLGPDPLDNSLTVDEFVNLISSEKRKIKQVLLDQKVIAGVGNIYSDEALWLSKINPLTPANRIGEKQLRNLFRAVKKVLKKSIRLRGSSMRNYRDTEGKEGGYMKARLVYAREGLPCFRCQTKIKRIKIGTRSSHFCPKCQKL